jgi:4-amino-4-deoxy-L-arabinose transferase-like glycosyltransferase
MCVEVRPRDLAKPCAFLASALLLFVVALRGAAAGVLGVAPAAIVMPASFLVLVATLHRLAVALGSRGPLHRRPGFWVIAAATVLYLPRLGSTSLIDPWEPHYGEVAREMIARADFISPWWAQDKWFWSKPVLDLWLEALSMRLSGVHAEAGAMLAPVLGVTPRPEWALRLPAFLFAVVGLYFLYRGVAKVASVRAGVLAALVLATTAQFFLMAEQATTDMPLVGSLAATMGLWLSATAAQRREEAPSIALLFGGRGRVVELGAVHLVLLGAVALVLPQVVYLVSRNVTLPLHLHADVFWSGSAGNCDIPGNAACVAQTPAYPNVPPALQALVWAAALAVVIAAYRAERSLERVTYLGAFFFATLATMAKGPVGIVLPAAAGLATLVVTGRVKALARVPIPGGVLLVLAATLPWYVAAFSRHGAAFTDELVFRHMIGRATSHLHDTNGGDDVSFRYYVWQLGYATFPWAGLLPVALAFWPSRCSAPQTLGARRARLLRSARAFSLLWFALTFALFTSMPTKFHHYIFPALPALAVLVGLLLDDALARVPEAASGPFAAAMAGAAVLVLLVTRDLATPGLAGEARLLNLVTYNYSRPWPEALSVRGPVVVAGIAMAVLLAAFAIGPLRRFAAIGLVGGALGFAVWGVDGYLRRVAPHWGQRALIEVYYRTRTSDHDPIAAFNLNWHGENLYTGNRVAVFPAGGRIAPWIDARRREGARVVFFLTEHARIAALRTEVGAAGAVEPLTSMQDNNKIVLVKVTVE